ncbi:beta-lactamase family protein [Streptomyces phaeochromogenes]|nr:beta-lactamase family protein [Streptomyces phaeochromogenes]
MSVSTRSRHKELDAHQEREHRARRRRRDGRRGRDARGRRPTTTLPAPSAAGVLAVQKQAMADGASGALTRIDSGTSRYRISPGKADTASGTAMDADRRFRVGSVTESFTTVVLM